MAPNNSLLSHESRDEVLDDDDSMSSLFSDGFDGVSEDTDLTSNNKRKGYPGLPQCFQENMGSAADIMQIPKKTDNFVSPINLENELYELEEQGLRNAKLQRVEQSESAGDINCSIPRPPGHLRLPFLSPEPPRDIPAAVDRAHAVINGTFGSIHEDHRKHSLEQNAFNWELAIRGEAEMESLRPDDADREDGPDLLYLENAASSSRPEHGKNILSTGMFLATGISPLLSLTF
jgi:hypothetical protein